MLSVVIKVSLGLTLFVVVLAGLLFTALVKSNSAQPLRHWQ